MNDPAEIKSLPLPDQLQELEDTYAECILEGDIVFLSRLWIEIKRLRSQLSLPIYA